MTCDLTWLMWLASLARWKGWASVTVGRNAEGYVAVVDHA
jgi:hypothetical protein